MLDILQKYIDNDIVVSCKIGDWIATCSEEDKAGLEKLSEIMVKTDGKAINIKRLHIELTGATTLVCASNTLRAHLMKKCVCPKQS